MISLERSRMLLFWKNQRKFEMLELENLLNEKQTILIRKMNFSGEGFFSEKKYGHVINVKFLENSDHRGKSVFGF
jgi:hypothetical protein